MAIHYRLTRDGSPVQESASAGPVTVGSGAGCTLVLAGVDGDATVLRVSERDGGLIVEVVGSASRLLVQGAPATAGTTLPFAAGVSVQIVIGPYLLVLVATADADRATAREPSAAGPPPPAPHRRQDTSADERDALHGVPATEAPTGSLEAKQSAKTEAGPAELDEGADALDDLLANDGIGAGPDGGLAMGGGGAGATGGLSTGAEDLGEDGFEGGFALGDAELEFEDAEEEEEAAFEKEIDSRASAFDSATEDEPAKPSPEIVAPPPPPQPAPMAPPPPGGPPPEPDGDADDDDDLQLAASLGALSKQDLGPAAGDEPATLDASADEVTFGTTPAAAAAAMPAPKARARRSAAPAKSKKKAADRSEPTPPPSPARPAPRPADVTVDEKPELPAVLHRKATVRYYTHMNPFRNFPLLVVISKHQIERIVQRRVAQVESRKKLVVRRSQPIVKIAPHFPGCLCVPESRDVDVTPEHTELAFWITPQAEGKLNRASVEIWYEGQLLDTVPCPTVVRKQTLSRMAATAGVISPVFFSTFEGMTQSTVQEEMTKGINAGLPALATAVGGFTNLGLIAGGACLLGALGFWWWARPRKGDPVESFMNVNTVHTEEADE